MAKANRQGRIGKGVANVFSGLLFDARDGSPYHIKGRSKNGVKTRILINRSSIQGKAPAVTFPHRLFEHLTLWILKINPPNSEVKALLDALDTADDKVDVRLRLRDALRKTLAHVYLLVVPRGRNRLASMQLGFMNKKRLNYLMVYQPAPSGPSKAATPTAGRKFGGGRAWRIINNVPDLRKKAGIADEERRLKEINAKELFLAMLEIGKFKKNIPHTNYSDAEMDRIGRAWTVLKAARLLS